MVRLLGALCAIVSGLGWGATDAAPSFSQDKTSLMVYRDADGAAHPVKTAADWETRRARILDNVRLVMGPLPDASRKVPLDMRVLDEVDCGAFVRKHITFAVEAGDRLPAYLFVPKGNPGKMAALVCPHPRYNDGKAAPSGLGVPAQPPYACELAARGYVTLAPDYPGFGEYVDALPALYKHGYASATAKGVWNHMRCIDLLQGLAYVDPGRIGCIGHSLGGLNTLFLGMFDPRVKVMAVSCGFTSFPKYRKGDLSVWACDRYMPRVESVYGKDPARMPFDFGEVLGVLAPRTVFISAPQRDEVFEMSGVDDCVKAARPVFALYGAEDRLSVEHPEAGHAFPSETRQRAYACIDSVIGGK